MSIKIAFALGWLIGILSYEVITTIAEWLQAESEKQ